MTLSKQYRQRLYDICYAIKAEVEVPLDDRIWMKKRVDHDKHALGLMESLMCPDFIGDDPADY